MVQRENSGSMDECVTFDRGECEGGQNEPVGEFIGMENASKGFYVYLIHWKQAYHEAQSSVLAIDGVQLARAVTRIMNGCAPTQSDSVSKRGLNEADADAKQMEFEGESEVAATL